MPDLTLCLSTACRDRKTCQRHWQHHEGSQENPRQSYTTFDGSYGKERCEGYVERKRYKQQIILASGVLPSDIQVIHCEEKQ